MLVRLVTIIIGPPILVWAFVSTFIRETGNAARYAWQEVRIEFDCMRRSWREKKLDLGEDQ